MKTQIFYFSGTGNSLFIARQLAFNLGESEVINLADSRQVPSAPRVGVVFPVYFLGLPLVVVDFLRRNRFDQCSYVFSAVDYGGMAGAALPQFQRILSEQNVRVNASFLLKMPDNYAPVFDAPSEHDAEALIDRAVQKIQDISRFIQAGKSCGAGFVFPPVWVSRLVYARMSKKIPAADRAFWADDKCNACGVCVKICPVKNVVLQDGKPAWNHQCQQCFACFHWCPQTAVQYKKKTLNRRRYHNTRVKVQDFFRR